jgi:hypothetical protein
MPNNKPQKANPKSEALNSKQTQITKIQNPKHISRYFSFLQKKRFKWECFKNLNFGFRNYLGFRISRLGYNRAIARLFL